MVMISTLNIINIAEKNLRKPKKMKNISYSSIGGVNVNVNSFHIDLVIQFNTNFNTGDKMVKNL